MRSFLASSVNDCDTIALAILHGDISIGSFENDVAAVERTAGYRRARQFDFILTSGVILNQIVSAGINVNVCAATKRNGIVPSSAEDGVRTFTAFD